MHSDVAVTVQDLLGVRPEGLGGECTMLGGQCSEISAPWHRVPCPTGQSHPQFAFNVFLPPMAHRNSGFTYWFFICVCFEKKKPGREAPGASGKRKQSC